MIVPDNETAVDLLYYEAVARTVMRLVYENADEPLTVGIHGDWGAGKSSVLLMLEEAYRKKDRVLCVRFNGWVFQGFEDAKAVLIETIVEELLRSRSLATKVVDQAKKVLKRVDWMKLARRIGGLALTATTGIPDVAALKELRDAAAALLGKDASAISEDELKEVVRHAGEYIKDSEPETVPKQMHAFREEFEELLSRADIDRLIVLVDDLDRCLPHTAIETLEAIRLFLFVPRAAFVIGADEGMIEYAVREHFPNLPSSGGTNSYARNYLEKLIQVPFRLPALGYTETRIYVALLLAAPKFKKGSAEFGKVLDLARTALKRPWATGGLDRKSIGEAIGSVPAPIEQALQLSEQIAPILTEGARGNPRQIKRFINTMALRQAIAEERGFGSDIAIPTLAKIMLAERFAPEIYDAIARESAAGASESLQKLEAAVRTPDSATATGRKRSGKIVEAEDLPDWPNVEWAKQWAAIDPPLSAVDLRPYVFVTRDRRSHFGAAVFTNQLDELLERLSGGALQVKQAAPDVQRLGTAEAEQLFGALRDRLVKADDLQAQPPGAAGLAALAQHHAFLQPALVEMLRALPRAKLGPWVVSGWSAAFTGSSSTAYIALVAEWAAQDENKTLQAAAIAVGKIGTKTGGA